MVLEIRSILRWWWAARICQRRWIRAYFTSFQSILHLLLNRDGQGCSLSSYRFSRAQSIDRSWASSYIFHWLLLNDKWWQLEIEIPNFILECLYLYSWFLLLQFASIICRYCELVGCLRNLIVLSDWTLDINIFRGRLRWTRCQLWFQLVITIVNKTQSRSMLNASALPFFPAKNRVFWIFIQWRRLNAHSSRQGSSMIPSSTGQSIYQSDNVGGRV